MSRLPTFKGLRVRYGLSQTAEARKLFISPNAVSKIENHLQTPSPKLVGKICNLFQVAPDGISFKRSLPLPKQNKNYAKSISYNQHSKHIRIAPNKDPKKYKPGQVIIDNHLLYFCLTKKTFMHEIKVLRRSTAGMANAFMEAFSVLADPKYDWNTLYKTAGLSRNAIYKNNSKDKRRKVLVEYQFRTLLRLAYVPYQHINIRRHFNFNMPAEDANVSVKKALKKYHIDTKKINHMICVVLHHRTNKELADRMGVSVHALRSYRTQGFNILSMTFREITVLLDAYRELSRQNNKDKTSSITMPSGYEYKTIQHNGKTYLLVTLKRAFDVDSKLHN